MVLTIGFNQHRLAPYNSIAIVPHSTTQDFLYYKYILQMTIDSIKKKEIK